MTNDWYKIVPATDELTQGDLIFDCPLVDWDPKVQMSGGAEEELLKDAIRAISSDVVVMTQACDLENKKVNNVILCSHNPLEEYKSVWETDKKQRNQNPTEKSWKSHFEDICDGFIWNLAVLNSYKEGALAISPRIVNFHSVYTVPRPFLESILNHRGKPRLQLLPPYREHLSQAFARFFMRIGLPAPISDE